MDFPSKRRGDLLVLLLSISTTTCSAPPDDHIDVTPDPPSVEMTNPPTAAADDMSASPVLRLAPDECPPDRLTGEADLWTEPDSVLLGAGLLLELQGCESVGGNAWRTYHYDGPAPVTPYHVVEIHYYGGFSWLVVNAEARRWQVVRSRPVFSPDGAWFATAWSDVETDYGYNPSHLDIWAVEADSVRRVLALTGGMEWGAVDPRWVSSNRVEYLRTSLRAERTSALWIDSVTTGVTQHDAEWVPDALPTSTVATAPPPSVESQSADSLDFADELANLVGLKHRSGFLEGARLIWAWSIEDYNGAEYGVEELEYLGHTVLVLDSLTHRESQKAFFQIVAVLEIPPLADREIVVARMCYLNDEWDMNLVAIVEDEDEDWYTNVKRVWRANPNPASFDEIPTTGVKCSNEFYGLDH